jgi:UV DNA damage endonuclease
MPINLGLCCINTELRKQKPPIFCSRTCIRRTFSVEKAKTLALQNIRDIIPMIEWNYRNDINCFRLSSDMFPHFSDTETESYTIDFSSEILKKSGDLAKTYNQRILMHPGQYNQVGSNKEEVFEKTIYDLQHHAHILDLMGIDTNNGSLIIHGGGIYGDKEKTIRRWIERFDDLPQNVKNRLVIENCERNYNIDDCLYIHEQVKIPVVFDFHHHYCYSKIHNLQDDTKQKSLEEIIPLVCDTWKDRVLMHISEQGSGKIGHHSDFIEKIPDELLNYEKNNSSLIIDLEVEAKMKEQAIFKLYEKYPYLRNKNL